MLDVVFTVFVSVKVSLLGGDVFWWVIFRVCMVFMVYRLYAAPFVSCFVNTSRLAGMTFNNIC